MRRLNRLIAITMLSSCLLAASAWAQDESVQPVAPLPAIGQDNGSNQGNSSNNAGQQDAPTITPDTNPPTGARDLTLGVLEGGDNELSGGLNFMETGDTNPQLSKGGTKIGAWTSLSGNLALDRSWKSNTLKVQYTAGGFLPNTASLLGPTQAHQFGLSDMFTTGRWSLLLSDDAVYAPEGGYGFGGLGTAAGQLGISSFTGLSPSLMNEQNAFVMGRRLSNTSVGQVRYNLSAHSSFTLVGSYGLLHFMDSGLIDSHRVIAEAGYDYAPTQHDTFYLNYAFGQFHFGGPTNGGLKAHSVVLGYTRRLTGRLLFDVAAGPQLISTESTVSVPLFQLGPFVIFGLEKEAFRRVSWTAHTGLKYHLGRTGLSVSYQRAAMGGSGVLAGAETSGVHGSVDRTVGHWWDTSAAVGYAHSAGLGGSGGRAYNTTYVRAAVHRRLGRTKRLEFSYQLQHQATNVPCTSSVCATDFLRHVFGIGFGWQFRPIRID